LGGSTPIGILGYINAVKELKKQSEEKNFNIDHIILAVGSGGTQAGVELGVKFYKMNAKCHGISASRHIKPKSQEIADLCNQTVGHFNLKYDRFLPEDINVNYDYIGEGYAIPTNECIKAIRIVAQKEGIILDPVYTGKAMAGLIDFIKKGKFKKDENIVFIHTGGQTGNFAYNKYFR